METVMQYLVAATAFGTLHNVLNQDHNDRPCDLPAKISGFGVNLTVCTAALVHPAARLDAMLGEARACVLSTMLCLSYHTVYQTSVGCRCCCCSC